MKQYGKALLFIVILALGLVFLVGCNGSNATTDDSTTAPDTTSAEVTTTEAPVSVARPTEEETMALDMLATFMEQYAVSGGRENNAYVNVKEYYDQSSSGYLWSNFSAAGMQYYVCKLYPEDEEQKELYRLMINNFRYFRQNKPENNEAENSVKYHSSRGSRVGGGFGDCFFDDNVWVARNYLRAYEILGDEWYLEEAIRVNNWVLSGWNEELGGLVWSEVGLTDQANAQHLERGLSANACSILVNAQLSMLMESEEEKGFYLQWAEIFYNFCKKMQNTPSTYDYWNGIATIIQSDGTRKDGEINKVHYSYNSGSMILANLALYEATSDSEKKAVYMEDAIKTAAAAKRTFYRTDSGTAKKYYTGDPWFAAILHEAYFELAKYDDTAGANYLDSFSKNVKLAYSNREESTKLLPYQAPWKVDLTWTNRENLVLHQVGFVQQAVMAALYSIAQDQ